MRKDFAPAESRLYSAVKDSNNGVFSSADVQSVRKLRGELKNPRNFDEWCTGRQKFLEDIDRVLSAVESVDKLKVTGLKR